MNDMSQVIIPKSDQLNADDLIAGPITVTICEVRITPGSEQPVSMMLEGTDKAYRPCKSMSRVFVHAWGADAKAYVGRSITLYRDPTVKWGGLEVGGIRISHMSDIPEAKQMMLTATKGSRKPHKVLPLAVEKTQPTQDPATKFANAYVARLATFDAIPALDAFVSERALKLNELQAKRPELYDMVSEAISERVVALADGGQPTLIEDRQDDEQHDPETGEIIDHAPAATSSAPEPRLPEGMEPEPQQADNAADAPHPAQARADEIIADYRAIISIMDLNSVASRAKDDVAAMPIEIAATVTAEFEASKARIATAHETAKKAERAGAQ